MAEDYSLITGRALSLGKPVEQSPWDIYQSNKPYAITHNSYQTTLPEDEEEKFRSWVEKNKVPFEFESEFPDYDMRGYWKALQEKDPRATFDRERMHFPDVWKTPFHESFSNESIYANPYTAPRWEDNQLVTPMGKTLFRE